MKKIQLSIPMPCHENWDAMKPSEKGKFCTSCQKTVIDFTEMSDRQIAEFFKRPPSSVCGRFQEVQLNRNIEIPRKRIPWVKYFFQFSLPAFLISMKAGAQVGKPVMKGETILVPKSENSKMKPNISNSRKKTTSIQNPQPVCLPNQMSSVKDKIPELKSEPLTNLNSGQDLEGYVGGVVIIVGGVGSKKTVTGNSKSQSLIKKVFDSTSRILDTLQKKFSVYPNPVKKHSSLKIDFKKLDVGLYAVSIVSLTGEIITTEKLNIQSKQEIVDFPLGNVAAGTYFIRVINAKTAASYSEKIIVQ